MGRVRTSDTRQTLILKELDYVALARVAGASPIRIMLLHLAPGVLSSAIVIATFNVGGLILAEATLSFPGAGSPPPTAAWGVMIFEGKDYLASAWWQAVIPGTAISLTIMSLNFLGDWLRDPSRPQASAARLGHSARQHILSCGRLLEDAPASWLSKPLGVAVPHRRKKR